MTKKLKSIRQVMELSIHHDIPPDADQAQTREEWTLEGHLDTLPPEFAAAIRVEMAKGTLVVNLVPGTSGIRITASKPRGKRPKNPSGA
jgi:hypothetical protein